MLCQIFTMDNTTFNRAPYVSTSCTPRTQLKTDTIYSSWEESTRQVDKIQPRLSRSLRNLSENFSAASDGDWLSQTPFGVEFIGHGDESKRAEEAQMQVPTEKPVGQFLSVGDSNWRQGRRASEGSIFATGFSGQVVQTFGVPAEENTTDDSQPTTKSCSTEARTTRPLTRNRRGSVDCLRSSSPCVQRVRVEVLQPRSKESANDAVRKTQNNEFFRKSKRDSDDATLQELLAKMQRFHTSKSPETLPKKTIAAETKMRARAINESTEIDKPINKMPVVNQLASNKDTTVIARPIPRESRVERSIPALRESLSDGEYAKRDEVDSGVGRTRMRRYSVATSRPASSFAQPHETLEYARQLLTKLQSEGKNKSKKEHLGALSRALKWILEKLNRIEVPDPDLVNMFVSLREQIADLKTEVKAEECNLPPNVLKGMDTMSQRGLLSTSQDKSDRVSVSRPFSWC